MWEYPNTGKTHGIGYLLRNHNFNFNLDNVLPRLLPSNYCSEANPNQPWNLGNACGLITMGTCLYENQTVKKELTKSELDPHLTTPMLKGDYHLYLNLNLQERLEADGGIKLKSSRWLKGLWKVTNLPGNSAACFFNIKYMRQILTEKLLETGHVWLVLPWDADALYLVNPTEINWEKLFHTLWEELEIEYPQNQLPNAEIHATTPDFWVIPRYSVIRQFYALVNNQWKEIPGLCNDPETTKTYIKYRTYSLLNSYAYTSRHPQQNLPHLHAEQNEIMLISELNPHAETIIPRSDWITLPSENQPLCKLSTLANYLGETCQQLDETNPLLLRIPRLKNQQIKELRELDEWNQIAETKQLLQHKK